MDDAACDGDEAAQRKKAAMLKRLEARHAARHRTASRRDTTDAAAAFASAFLDQLEHASATRAALREREQQLAERGASLTTHDRGRCEEALQRAWRRLRERARAEAPRFAFSAALRRGGGGGREAAVAARVPKRHVDAGSDDVDNGTFTSTFTTITAAAAGNDGAVERCEDSAPRAAAAATTTVADVIDAASPRVISREALLPRRNTVYITRVERSTLALPCWLSTLHVESCTDAVIRCGPVATSACIAACRRCVMVVAARQVRLRDCEACDLYVDAPAGVVLEACRAVRIAPYDYVYEEIRLDRAAAAHGYSSTEAGVQWRQVTDFDALGGEQSANWSFMPRDDDDDNNNAAR